MGLLVVEVFLVVGLSVESSAGFSVGTGAGFVVVGIDVGPPVVGLDEVGRGVVGVDVVG